MIALSSLTRFAAAGRAASPHARCELCGNAIDDAHRHVVEIGQRGVSCACQACSILFTQSEAGSRFRTIPDRVRVDRSFALSAATWAELGIPVSLAFCYRDSARAAGVVCYPGPAGVTDAELEPAAWDAITAATPLARDLEDDVEALLVRGARGAQSLACYLVPISLAYELVGKLRESWRGFSGGEEAEAELARFFGSLEERGGQR